MFLFWYWFPWFTCYNWNCFYFCSTFPPFVISHNRQPSFGAGSFYFVLALCGHCLNISLYCSILLGVLTLWYTIIITRFIVSLIIIFSFLRHIIDRLFDLLETFIYLYYDYIISYFFIAMPYILLLLFTYCFWVIPTMILWSIIFCIQINILPVGNSIEHFYYNLCSKNNKFIIYGYFILITIVSMITLINYQLIICFIDWIYLGQINTSPLPPENNPFWSPNSEYGDSGSDGGGGRGNNPGPIDPVPGTSNTNDQDTKEAQPHPMNSEVNTLENATEMFRKLRQQHEIMNDPQFNRSITVYSNRGWGTLNNNKVSLSTNNLSLLKNLLTEHYKADYRLHQGSLSYRTTHPDFAIYQVSRIRPTSTVLRHVHHALNQNFPEFKG